MVEEIKTCSISLRLRRVTYEDAYVSVPVTNAIMKQEKSGMYGIDMDAFIAEAIRLGNSPGVDWKVEASQIEPHPTQGPKPEGRVYFEWYLEDSNKG